MLFHFLCDDNFSSYSIFNVDDNFEVSPGPSSSKKRFRIGFPNSGVDGAPLLPRKNEEE